MTGSLQEIPFTNNDVIHRLRSLYASLPTREEKVPACCKGIVLLPVYASGYLQSINLSNREIRYILLSCRAVCSCPVQSVMLLVHRDGAYERAERCLNGHQQC